MGKTESEITLTPTEITLEEQGREPVAYKIEKTNVTPKLAKELDQMAEDIRRDGVPLARRDD